MQYHPLTEKDQARIFDEIGIRSFDDLIKGIPASLRNPKIDLPAGLSEVEIQALVRDLGAKNQLSKPGLSFLGGGSYEHFIPSAVFDILGRNEFLTAYTPYQPEAAQGTLQSVFEYQSLMVELTGLEVSNASHYDGATSLAEACILALRHTDRKKILMAASVHPHYRGVVHTYLNAADYRAEEFGFDQKGNLNHSELLDKIDDETSAVVIQTPNYFGNVEDLTGLADKLHQKGILLILICHPLSMAIFKTPGEWGADIAVGEGQPLGIAPSFGGPYLGYFTVAKALMRKIPGRIAGLTEDDKGRRAFVLTLQAREQHIRRERALSNICTNQALCALAACTYMTLLGRQGMREVAELNLDRSWYLRERISKIPGFKVDTQQSIFNEFMVSTDKHFSKIESSLMAQGIFPGISLAKDYRSLQNHFLVCATETKTRKDLDLFVEALSRC